MIENTLEDFLSGKSEHTRMLFEHFIKNYKKIGKIEIHPAKTMIGIGNGNKRIAWVTQLGKNFIHVVFPFKQPYNDNLCFQKIAQVPGDSKQFNHHFRMLQTDDINAEVQDFMKLGYREEGKNKLNYIFRIVYLTCYYSVLISGICNSYTTVLRLYMASIF